MLVYVRINVQVLTASLRSHMILRSTAKQRYLNMLERKRRCLSDFQQLVSYDLCVGVNACCFVLCLQLDILTVLAVYYF